MKMRLGTPCFRLQWSLAGGISYPLHEHSKLLVLLLLPAAPWRPLKTCPFTHHHMTMMNPPMAPLTSQVSYSSHFCEMFFLPVLPPYLANPVRIQLSPSSVEDPYTALCILHHQHPSEDLSPLPMIHQLCKGEPRSFVT
jgi:hypothetical protein